MIKGKIAYIILGIILVTALFLRIFSKEDNWVCTNSAWTKHGNPSSAKPETECLGAKEDAVEKFILEGSDVPVVSTSTQISTSTSVLEEVTPVVISAPESGTLVSTPLVVRGQALGSWFFEASLPVKLLDDKGQTIAIATASAESNWMVNTLVPFSALLEFNTTATSGYLVISKDNPSGLKENDASISIPLKFLNK